MLCVYYNDSEIFLECEYNYSFSFFHSVRNNRQAEKQSDCKETTPILARGNGNALSEPGFQSLDFHCSSCGTITWEDLFFIARANALDAIAFFKEGV